MEGHDHEVRRNKLDLKVLWEVKTDQILRIAYLEGCYGNLQSLDKQTWEDYEAKRSQFRRRQSEIIQHQEPSENVSGDFSTVAALDCLQFCNPGDLRTRLTRVLGTTARNPMNK